AFRAPGSVWAFRRPLSDWGGAAVARRVDGAGWAGRPAEVAAFASAATFFFSYQRVVAPIWILSPGWRTWASIFLPLRSVPFRLPLSTRGATVPARMTSQARRGRVESSK